MKNISRVLTALGLSFVLRWRFLSLFGQRIIMLIYRRKNTKKWISRGTKITRWWWKTNNVTTIQASLDFLQQIQTQQKIITICKIRLLMQILKFRRIMPIFKILKQLSTPNNTDYASQSLATLQAQLEKLTNQQQDAQSALSAVNTQLAGQSAVSERAQTALTDNVKRTQELNQKLADPTTSSLLKQQIQLELQLIELKMRTIKFY